MKEFRASLKIRSDRKLEQCQYEKFKIDFKKADNLCWKLVNKKERIIRRIYLSYWKIEGVPFGLSQTQI